MTSGSTQPGPRVIVALDFPDAPPAEALAARLSPTLCRLKIGKELFTAAGPALVERLQRQGFQIFLDLKYHDIPNTVMQACKAAANLGVWMLNVHALGGRAMLQAACEGVRAAARPEGPLVIGVTVLTSHTQADLDEAGIAGTPDSAALRLATLTRECGLDGVVCSAQEATRLRSALGAQFLLVTPGIRTAADASDDQKRIMTPAAAIECGASYLVVGRPVTRAPDPLAALAAINQEVAAALAAARKEEA